eukprot:gene4466-3261_t
MTVLSLKNCGNEKTTQRMAVERVDRYVVEELKGRSSQEGLRAPFLGKVC